MGVAIEAALAVVEANRQRLGDMAYESFVTIIASGAPDTGPGPTCTRVCSLEHFQTWFYLLNKAVETLDIFPYILVLINHETLQMLT